MFGVSRHVELKLSIILFRQECLLNSYMLEGNSGRRIIVETDLGFAIYMSDVNFSMVKGLQRTQQTDQKLL